MLNWTKKVLRTPQSDRAKKLVLCVFLSALLFLALTSLILCTYLVFFTDYWYVVALYLVYQFLDRKTPESGGKRSHWVRNWKLWQHMANYFPTSVSIELVASVDLGFCLFDSFVNPSCNVIKFKAAGLRELKR